MLLKVGIAHLRCLRLGVLFVRAYRRAVKQCPFLHPLTARTSPAMEPYIPSKLDIPNNRSSRCVSPKDTSELNNSLVIQWDWILGRICESISRILQVFRVCIVQGSNLTLCGTVFLLWVRHVVVLRWKESCLWHAWSESPSQIGSRELIPCVQGHLSLHACHFIPAIQDLEVLELSLVR